MHSFITRKQTLSLTFTSTTYAAVFTITNVYAPADHWDSLAFLLDLEEVASQNSGNWVLAGDFNLTRDASDNSRGGVDTRLANAFNDSIHKLGLIDIPLLDKLFTWSNHRDCPTLARLDRFFFNNARSTAFPNSSLVSAPKPTSDHTPILLTISTSIPKPNLFRFENAWLYHQDFSPLCSRPGMIATLTTQRARWLDR
jgi:exonuclease III